MYILISAESEQQSKAGADNDQLRKRLATEYKVFCCRGLFQEKTNSKLKSQTMSPDVK